MKREMEKLALRDAFAPMPEDCRMALMRAARSVKEEKARRLPLRTALIAAAILLATLSVALAASRILGWMDYYGLYSVSLPQKAQEALDGTPTREFEVGPLTLTLEQALCDGRIAMTSFEAHTTDGTPALYADDIDVYDAIGSVNDSEANRLGVDPSTTWMETAKQLGLPLYSVRALIERGGDYAWDTEMEDALWNEDGHIVYLSMPQFNTPVRGETLPVVYYLAVSAFNPETEEMIDHWVVREKAEIPIGGVLEERTYWPEKEASCAGYELKNVVARRHITGVYLTLTFARPLMNEENLSFYRTSVLDAQGEAYARGASLSGEISETVTVEEMVSLDALPEEMQVSLPDGTVVAVR